MKRYQHKQHMSSTKKANLRSESKKVF